MIFFPEAGGWRWPLVDFAREGAKYLRTSDCRHKSAYDGPGGPGFFVRGKIRARRAHPSSEVVRDSRSARTAQFAGSRASGRLANHPFNRLARRCSADLGRSGSRTSSTVIIAAFD